ncbi:MAG: sugar phosphate isomerase/epimerase [Candidatus Aureabacteria bacterium]|nr:sugar phosphate isomerase/epimerase [Candidatus Auribacterota bacterium]
MNTNLFFNVPLEFLLTHEDLMDQYPVNAEVFVDGEDLERVDAKQIERARRLFQEKHLRRRVHGPISEMVLGAFDPRIQDVSRSRFLQAIEFADAIGAESVTLHSGFDTLNKRNCEVRYTENLVSSLRFLSGEASRRKKHLMLENTFEPSPDLLLEALSRVGAANLKLCFDIAHHHVFGRAPLEEWIARCAPWIEEVHITDNRGEWDDHLAPGMGEIDFAAFFRLLKEHAIRPVFTFEPHDVDAFVETLKYITQHQDYFM